MNKIDPYLLYETSEDSRKKLSDIGKLLTKSTQSILYLNKALKNNNILHDPYCIFDYSYFGLLLFRVYFTGGYISDNEKNLIITELRKNPNVIAIYELAGQYDLVIEFAAKNPSRFNKEFKKVTNIIPTFTSYKIILNIVSHIYPRLYLTKKAIPQDHIIGGDREPYNFTQNEISVIQQLLVNPKIRYSELARKTSINIKTVKKIFNSLIKNQIIKGFKYIINFGKADITQFRLFLKLHNLSMKQDKELLNFLYKKEEIIQMHRTVGDWDMEIDIESANNTKIRKAIAVFREKFREQIQNYTMAEVQNVYYRRYLPDSFFKA